MSPEEQVAALSKISELIAALEADYASYMVGFNAQIVQLHTQIKEVMDAGTVPEVVKPKRAYNRKAKPASPPVPKSLLLPGEEVTLGTSSQ